MEINELNTEIKRVEANIKTSKAEIDFDQTTLQGLKLRKAIVEIRDVIKNTELDLLSIEDFKKFIIQIVNKV